MIVLLFACVGFGWCLLLIVDSCSFVVYVLFWWNCVDWLVGCGCVLLLVV